VAIAGLTAVFASVAYNENDLAAALVALGEIGRGSKNCVIQNSRRLGWRHRALVCRGHGNSLDDGTPRGPRSAHKRRAVFLATDAAQFLQPGRESRPDRSPSGLLADGVAVGIDRELIEFAERSL